MRRGVLYYCQRARRIALIKRFEGLVLAAVIWLAHTFSSAGNARAGQAAELEKTCAGPVGEERIH